MQKPTQNHAPAFKSHLHFGRPAFLLIASPEPVAMKQLNLAPKPIIETLAIIALLAIAQWLPEFIEKGWMKLTYNKQKLSYHS